MRFTEKIKSVLKGNFKFHRYEANKRNLYLLIKSLRPVQTRNGLIRFGSSGDGGYLIPNDLEGITACFSPGVGPVIEFEKECAKNGMKVYMADASVTKPDYTNENIHFIDKYIGSHNNDEFIKIEDWVLSQGFKETNEFILQMDVEGAEYDIFKNISSSFLKKFRIIIVEFHHLDRLDQNNFFRDASFVFNKILKTHKSVHIHPNNCRPAFDIFGMEVPKLLEITFYRNDKIEKSTKLANLPHALDSNNTSNETLNISDIWYKDI